MRRWRENLVLCLPLLVFSVVALSPARREERPPLRVCADPNNLPFSDSAENGFENRIATLIARHSGQRLEYTWWPARRGFIRNTLRAGRCDIVMGVPSSYELTMPSIPYYRSTYVFVTRTDRHLAVRSFDDSLLRHLRVGVHMMGDDYANSPAALALLRRRLGAQIVGYMIYGDYSKAHPPSALIDAVTRGDVDVRRRSISRSRRSFSISRWVFGVVIPRGGRGWTANLSRTGPTFTEFSSTSAFHFSPRARDRCAKEFPMMPCHRTLITLVVAPALLAACASRVQDETGGTIPQNAYYIGPQPGPDRAFPPVTNPYAGNQAARVDGRRLYQWYNCAGCHGNHAGGGMGPSLRDDDWLYGGDDASVFASITEGRREGMPAWGSKVPSDQIWQIVTYIKSMRTPNERDAPR